MKLSFHGADRGVTGSCHLVECAGTRVLIDCGLYQGGRAAHGTLARQIIDGANTVNLFGEEVRVRAKLFTINGFSAHADQAELVAWQQRVGAPRTFLVHGEEEVMRQFSLRLQRTVAAMPKLGQEVEL